MNPSKIVGRLFVTSLVVLIVVWTFAHFSPRLETKWRLSDPVYDSEVACREAAQRSESQQRCTANSQLVWGSGPPEPTTEEPVLKR